MSELSAWLRKPWLRIQWAQSRTIDNDVARSGVLAAEGLRHLYNAVLGRSFGEVQMKVVHVPPGPSNSV